MKSILNKFGSVASLAITLSPVLAFAQGTTGVPSVSGSGITSVSGVFSFACTIINLLFGVLIVLAIFFIVLAAFKYVTAGGDGEKVKEASKQLLYAAIAVAVALLAKGIPFIVQSIVPNATISGFSC